MLVSVDTLRADRVGAYGDGAAHTPTLDGLAAEGVRFETALSPAPLTLPSHTSLLTGLEPPAHGVRNNSTFRLVDGVPTLAERFRDAGYDTAAFVGAVVLDRQYGLDRGFETYDDRMSPRMSAGEQSFAERTADRVVDAALDWLANADERFFLWIHLYDPHADYAPPAGFLAGFPGDPYRGEIAFTDAQLARLLAALDERFDPERTLLVATSDHGESLGEHGETTHSVTIYDATQKVPLLMRGPGVPAGRVVDEPVGLVDVAPTVLSLAGLPALEGAQGIDLSSRWRGPGARGDRARGLYMETLSSQIDMGWSPLLGLRREGYKYIRAPRPELYDLETDPGEEHNRFEQEPARAAELDAALSRHLAVEAPADRVGSAAIAPDEEQQRRLQQLGYLAEPEVDRAELGRVGGIDPKDGLLQLRELKLAWALLDRFRFRQALEALAPLGEDSHLVVSTRARAALGAGRLEQAEREARRALELAPDRVASHQMLGLVLLEQGRLDEAERAFELAAERDPAEGRPHVGLGRAAELRGDRDRARSLYRRAIERRGTSSEARWRLAALDLEDGEAGDADALLAELTREQLEHPDAAARLARAEARAGRIESARRRLAASLQAYPAAPATRAARAELAAAATGRAATGESAP